MLLTALSRVSQHGTPSQKKTVRAAVCRRYPSLPSLQIIDSAWFCTGAPSPSAEFVTWDVVAAANRFHPGVRPVRRSNWRGLRVTVSRRCSRRASTRRDKRRLASFSRPRWRGGNSSNGDRSDPCPGSISSSRNGRIVLPPTSRWLRSSSWPGNRCGFCRPMPSVRPTRRSANARNCFASPISSPRRCSQCRGIASRTRTP